MITLGSLFDGIGGFPLAAVRCGVTPIWASEIEAFPISVTKVRFPSMAHVGDITKLNGAELTPVDIVTGGSPCQDVSVAGKRAGLAGERSSLFMEQIRLIKEMRAADERRNRETGTALAVRPRHMVWENVPGAFSSKDGEDFRTVLEEAIRIVDDSISVPRPPGGAWKSAGAILGDQFSVAWRVLDARYWGVPQRRRRIFLVADFGGYTAPQILFEQESLPRDPTAGQGTWQSAAAATEGGAGTAGRTSRENAGEITAFAANQRDEVRDLHDVAAALSARPGMKQQTFIAGIAAKGDGGCFLSPEKHTTLSSGGQVGQGYPCILSAGFSAGAGASAGSIGYAEETTPTLKGAAGGNSMPSVLCLNDQGGSVMDCTKSLSGTLRAQEHGHQPLVMAGQQGGAEIGVGICPSITASAGMSGNNQPVLFDNHGIDARYTGPHEVAPTLTARYGTGGNNIPIVSQEPECFCISGNAIDREPLNGGNGLGVQVDTCYTLDTSDRHAVFSRQRVDVFRPDETASTQSARQYKDTTDLVCDVGDKTQDRTIEHKLIRRLTPLECERLQGYPDGWTDILGASDSARYKALGNSVAIPCVEFVLRGILKNLS